MNCSGAFGWLAVVVQRVFTTEQAEKRVPRRAKGKVEELSGRIIKGSPITARVSRPEFVLFPSVTVTLVL